jgi:hypothetical protein
MAGRHEGGSTTDRTHARHLTHIQHRYDDRRTTWSKEDRRYDASAADDSMTGTQFTTESEGHNGD